MLDADSQKPPKGKWSTPPFDPRFPNQNQTQNCYQNFLAVPHRQGSSESPDGADGCLTLSEVTQVASDHRANTCAALARLSTSPQVPRCPEATPSLPPSFHL
uniref:Uncharacterized protein n=1 Tax=Ursus maritimus TaxID=29073 RepID=A0A452VKM4_URSMA